MPSPLPALGEMKRALANPIDWPGLARSEAYEGVSVMQPAPTPMLRAPRPPRLVAPDVHRVAFVLTVQPYQGELR